MRYWSIVLTILFFQSYSFGQTIFSFEGKEAVLMDVLKPEKRTLHDDQIQSSDHEYVKAFKAYFNPGSYQNFLAHFPSSEWPNLPEALYNQWQQRLDANKIQLEQILHVKANGNEEFLVFQYTTESAAYIFYENKPMKKVQGKWRHYTLDEGAVTKLLKRVGDYKAEALSERTASQHINLDDIQASAKRTIVEKFDRELVFNKLINSLSVVDPSFDVQTAKQFFISGQDQAFIEYLAAHTSLSKSEWIDRINTSSGLSLYQSVNNEK